MVKLDAIQKRLIAEIADLHAVPAGAYNFRANSQLAGRNTTANIDIVSKDDGSGIIIRIKAADVSVLGRATQGVKIMKVEEGNAIISMAKVVKEEEDKDGQISMDIKPGK